MILSVMRVIMVSFIIVVTIPLLIVIGSIIYLVSGWPIFFVQKRVGYKNKPFLLYKFRTMVPNADVLKGKYASKNIADGPVFKIPNDPRFTPVGRFFSQTGLDELPQLLNIAKGEMAFLGPRPLPIDEAKKLEPWMRKRHNILPGIISPAILTGTYHRDFTAWMKNDVAYVQTKNPYTDLRIFAQSIVFLLRLLVLNATRSLRTYKSGSIVKT